MIDFKKPLKQFVAAANPVRVLNDVHDMMINPNRPFAAGVLSVVFGANAVVSALHGNYSSSYVGALVSAASINNIVRHFKGETNKSHMNSQLSPFAHSAVGTTSLLTASFDFYSNGVGNFNSIISGGLLLMSAINFAQAHAKNAENKQTKLDQKQSVEPK